MYKNVLIYLIFLVYPVFSNSLKVDVKNISQIKGQMLIALCQNKKQYDGEQTYFMQLKVPIITKDFVATFDSIPEGIYTVKIIHDADMDGKLKTNFLGMPKEPFGFSNDAKGSFGPPDYEDTTFEINKDTLIVINLKKL